MERESLLCILIVLLGGLVLQPFVWWPSAGSEELLPASLERKSWRRLWYPVVPTLLVASWLCGWALREPDPVRDPLDEARSQADQVRVAAAIMQRQLGELEARLPGLKSAAAAAKESLGRGELGLAAYASVESNSLAAQAEAIRLHSSLEQAQVALSLLLTLPF